MLALDELLVVAAGAGAIAWIYWYFFRAEGAVGTATATGAGPQTTTILVRGGYEPASIRVKAGAPVRLVFDRRETNPCSEEIVFPDFGIRRFLPANEKTAVEFTPARPGTYEFSCGMSMLRGKVIAE